MSSHPISDEDTPDPWVVASPQHGGGYYLTFTLGNRVEIWHSHTFDNFRQARKSVVWQPAEGSPWSADIWAPELHYLAGQWYVYTCAAPPGVGNPGHRTIVLRSSRSDPMDAAGWELLGPVRGLPDQWAIDATVFCPDPHDRSKLYICWSGWPPGDASDTQQDLFVMQMQSPAAAMPGATAVCVSRAELSWERPEGGRRGVNEGPQWVETSGPHGGFRGIVYSAHGSWTSEYKLGLLALAGPDPLQREHWVKRQTPLLVSDRAYGGPFGPGHASFVPSPWPNDHRLMCVYHATANENEGWANRKARVLPMDPTCFAQHAATMCCGMGIAGGGAPTPGSSGSGHGGSQAPAGGNITGGDKQWTGKRLREKMPPEVRGIFDKVKKFI